MSTYPPNYYRLEPLIKSDPEFRGQFFIVAKDDTDAAVHARRIIDESKKSDQVIYAMEIFRHIGQIRGLKR